MDGFFLTGFALIGLVRIVASVFKDKEPKKIPGKHQYIINNVVLPIHPITKSYEVLGIEKDTPIEPQLIKRAFSNQLGFAHEDRVLGYKMKYSLKEYQIARQYLLDYYDYVAFLN